MKGRSWITPIMFFLGLAIVIILIHEADKQTEDLTVLETIKNANYSLVFFAFVLAGGSLLVKNGRWYVLLKPKYRIGFRKLFPAFSFGYALSTTLPAKSGDLARLGVKKKYLDVEYKDSLGALLCYRVLDLLFLFFFGLISLLLFIYADESGVDILHFFTDLWYVFLIALGGFTLILLIIFSRRIGTKLAQGASSVVKRIWPSKGDSFEEKIRENASAFYDNVEKYRTKGTFAVIIVLTVLRWILEFLALHLVFRSVGVYVPIYITIISLVVYLFAGFLSPGGVGFGSFASIEVLISYGVSRVAATSANVLSLFVAPLLTVSVGLVSLIYLTMPHRNKESAIVPEKTQDPPS